MLSEYKHSKMDQRGHVEAHGLLPSLVLFLARHFPQLSWPPVRFTGHVQSSGVLVIAPSS